jgi:hypothetical protein
MTLPNYLKLSLNAGHSIVTIYAAPRMKGTFTP